MSLFLSRLILDPNNSHAKRDLANPYELYSTLCWAFANPKSERFLWRLEAAGRQRYPRVLVQSQSEPKWSVISEKEGCNDYFLETRTGSYSLPEKVLEGNTFSFRLEANPTKTNPKDGKRHGIKGAKGQIEWFQRQAEKLGFDLLEAAVSRSEYQRFPKRQEPGKLITVQATTFDGRLRITCPDDFQKAIVDGLGHAKALGFGLLSIAKG